MLAYEPWFEPVSRRLFTLAVAAAWLLVELSTWRFDLWFWAAAAATAFAVWELFLRGRYGRAKA